MASDIYILFNSIISITGHSVIFFIFNCEHAVSDIYYIAHS